MKHCSANAPQYEAKMEKIYRAIFAIISAVATDFKNPIILFNLLAFICGKGHPRLGWPQLVKKFFDKLAEVNKGFKTSKPLFKRKSFSLSKKYRLLTHCIFR